MDNTGRHYLYIFLLFLGARPTYHCPVVVLRADEPYCCVLCTHARTHAHTQTHTHTHTHTQKVAQWCMLIDKERWQLQGNGERLNDIDLKAGIRLKSLCISPVTTAPRGGQMESWCGKRRRLELSSEPSLAPVSTDGQMDSLWRNRRVLELSSEPAIPAVSTGGKMERLRGKRRGLELRAEPHRAVPRGGQMDSLWGKRRGLELRAELFIPPVNTGQYHVMVSWTA